MMTTLLPLVISALISFGFCFYVFRDLPRLSGLAPVVIGTVELISTIIVAAIFGVAPAEVFNLAQSQNAMLACFIGSSAGFLVFGGLKLVLRRTLSGEGSEKRRWK